MEATKNVAMCVLHAQSIDELVVRATGPKLEVLVAMGRQLCPLLGADARSGFELGEPLRLYQTSPTAGGERQLFDTGDFNIDTCVWDSWSASVYFKSGYAIFRLVGDEVTLVAGDPNERGHRDGPGPAARFLPMGVYIAQLASDGAGSIIFAEGQRYVRRIQLPTAWRAAAPPPTAAAGDNISSGAAAGEAVAADAVAQVDTLPYRAPALVHSAVCLLPPQQSSAATAATAAADAGAAADSAVTGAATAAACASGWLVLGTQTALYRVPLPLPAAAAPAPPPAPPAPAAAAPAAPAAGRARAAGARAAAWGAPGAGAAVAAAAAAAALPQQQQQQQLPLPLLSGSDGAAGSMDGRGPDARFCCFHGITADAAGRIYLADAVQHGTMSRRLRRVSPDGTVETLVAIPAVCWFPTILPNG